jgi:hypothetical protein
MTSIKNSERRHPAGSISLPVILILILLIGAVGFAVCYMRNPDMFNVNIPKMGKRIDVPSRTTHDGFTYSRLSASKLSKAFEQNQWLTMDIYSDDILLVTGKIHEVVIPAETKPYFTFEADTEASRITCFMFREQIPVLMLLKKKQKVSVMGNMKSNYAPNGMTLSPCLFVP